MSFEGRYQKLCTPCNHYEEQDVYMEYDKCPQCNKPWTKSNLVDDTNEGGEGFDYSMVIEGESIQSILDEYRDAANEFSAAVEKRKQNLLDFINSTEYPNPEFEKTFKK